MPATLLERELYSRLFPLHFMKYLRAVLLVHLGATVSLVFKAVHLGLDYKVCKIA